MIVYRLARERYSLDLSGKGSELAGGRWNSVGTKMIYTCSSKALCLLEVLVHVNATIIPLDYRMISIEIPDSVPVIPLNISDLPSLWRQMPWISETQKSGDDFITAQFGVVLKVPNAVVDGDHNFLLNPAHNDFSKIKIVSSEPFEFDSRLFRKRDQ